MYFLSNFLRQNKTRITYGDEVPLTRVKNNDYDKNQHRAEGCFLDKKKQKKRNKKKQSACQKWMTEKL